MDIINVKDVCLTLINTEVEIATKNHQISSNILQNHVGANIVRPSKQQTKSTTPTKSIVLLFMISLKCMGTAQFLFHRNATSHLSIYRHQLPILLAVILSYLNTADLTADSLRQLVHELNYSRILVRRS